MYWDRECESYQGTKEKIWHENYAKLMEMGNQNKNLRDIITVWSIWLIELNCESKNKHHEYNETSLAGK